MAKVKINGKDVGGVWTAPWQLDISSTVKSGENEIEILVVNNWMNRLIGDLRITEDKRPIWTVLILIKLTAPYNHRVYSGRLALKK